MPKIEKPLAWVTVLIIGEWYSVKRAPAIGRCSCRSHFGL